MESKLYSKYIKTEPGHVYGKPLIADGDQNIIVGPKTLQTIIKNKNTERAEEAGWFLAIDVEDNKIFYNNPNGLENHELNYFYKWNFEDDEIKEVFGPHIIKSDGTLWGIGNNTNFYLGTGDNVYRDHYEQIGTDTDWAKVYYDTQGSYALKNDGSLWATGIRYESYWTLLDSSEWVHIACYGPDVLYGIKSDGTLWYMGIPSIKYKYAPYADKVVTRVSTADNIPILGVTQFVQIMVDDTVKDVSCNALGTHVVKSDGSLWSIGLFIQGHSTTSMGPYTSWTRIGTDTDWKKTKTHGGYSGCLVFQKENGTIYINGGHIDSNPWEAATPLTGTTVKNFGCYKSFIDFYPWPFFGLTNDGWILKVNSLLGDNTGDVEDANNMYSPDILEHHVDFDKIVATPSCLWVHRTQRDLEKNDTWYHVGNYIFVGNRQTSNLLDSNNGYTFSSKNPVYVEDVKSICKDYTAYAIKNNGDLYYLRILRHKGEQQYTYDNIHMSNYFKKDIRSNSNNWKKIHRGGCVGIKEDGTLWASFNILDGQSYPVFSFDFHQIGTANNWIDVDTLSTSLVAVNSSGEIWCTSYDKNLMFGNYNSLLTWQKINPEATNVKNIFIDGGGGYYFFLTTTGHLYKASYSGGNVLMTSNVKECLSYKWVLKNDGTIHNTTTPLYASPTYIQVGIRSDWVHLSESYNYDKDGASKLTYYALDDKNNLYGTGAAVGLGLMDGLERSDFAFIDSNVDILSDGYYHKM